MISPCCKAKGGICLIDDFFVSDVGVRQGGNVSPMHFSNYVDELENYLSANGSVPLEVHKMFFTDIVPKLLVLLYADDTLIFADSPENNKKYLHYLSLCCKKCHLILNKNKTNIMIFSKRKLNHRSNFYYANKKVEIVQNFF